jgi:acyl-CoA synthetase (NDP forming)
VAAACRDAGIHQAATPRELAVLLEALSGTRRAAGRRTAVLTDGGGHGSIAADVAEAAGLAVPELSAELQAELRDLLWGPSAVRNPVDLAGMGEQDPASYPATVESLIGADEVDAVLMTGFFGGYSADGAEDGLGKLEVAAAERVAAAVQDGRTPVLVQSMYPDAPSCRVLAAAGVPVFGAVEDAVRALAAVTPRPPARVAPLPAAAAPIKDTGYFAVRAMLARRGVAFPDAYEVRDEAGCHRAATALAGPYALKGVGLLHKSDAGGVALGLTGLADLIAAFREMRGRLGHMPYSVERMVPAGGVEVIAGVKRDPRFGPVVMVGLGGIHAEVLRDVAFALAPIDSGRARDLLAGLRSAALLHGCRGRPPVDLEAAAGAVAALSTLAAAHPEISEIEINPLLVGTDGALALDARVIL